MSRFFFLSFSHHYSSKGVQRDLSVSVGPWRGVVMFEETGVIQRGFGEREVAHHQFWTDRLFLSSRVVMIRSIISMCKLHSISVFIKGLAKNDLNRFDISV